MLVTQWFVWNNKSVNIFIMVKMWKWFCLCLSFSKTPDDMPDVSLKIKPTESYFLNAYKWVTSAVNPIQDDCHS